MSRPQGECGQAPNVRNKSAPKALHVLRKYLTPAIDSALFSWLAAHSTADSETNCPFGGFGRFALKSSRGVRNRPGRDYGTLCRLPPVPTPWAPFKPCTNRKPWCGDMVATRSTEHLPCMPEMMRCRASSETQGSQKMAKAGWEEAYCVKPVRNLLRALYFTNRKCILVYIFL